MARQDLAGELSPQQLRGLPSAASRKVDFIQDIKPIFEASCIKCHARGRSKGGFQLDTRATLLRGGDSGPVIVAGESERSSLIALVAGVDPDNVMPKKGKRLSAEQVGLLRAWIDQGLPWDPKVAFGRPAPMNLTPHWPAQKILDESPVNPIDQLLEPYFAARHFSSPPVVDDHLFARRAFLDIVGLLPVSADIESFLADPHPNKRVSLVRRLLADNQRYAENWLPFWNDLLRNDYRGTGYIDGGRKQISSWLFAALTNNLSYDKFVAQLINPKPESAGFVNGIVWRGVVNASQTPQMQAAQNISQVFMGVNLKCASCHDSFVNDWQLADAYGLAAIYSDGPLELFQCDKPTGQTATARFIYPELGELDPQAANPARLARLAEVITGPKDGRLSRTIVNRLWARFFGRGLVESVDDLEQPAWNQDLLDWLAEDLAAHRYDLKHTIERILTSQAYQLPAVDLGEAAGKDYMFRGPGVRRLSAEQFRDALGQLTGVWFDKSELPMVTNEVRTCFVAADPLTLALGRPNREQVTTTRATAATTLQALELTNGGSLAQVLHRGAERLAVNGSQTDELIGQLYEAAFSRRPTPIERSLASSVVGQPVSTAGVEDLLWAMAMLPEFQLVY
jgi:mono/diheme cytochrome c family protein